MYAIHIFPELSSRIQSIRKKYDLLADKIPPHITLVYPMQDVSLQKLQDAVNTITTHSFEITTGDITIMHKQHILLIDKGKEILKQIHEQLYSILPDNRWEGSTYIPHITLGNKKISEAIPKESCIVNEIVIEEIQEDDSSRIVFRKNI
ncbi:MAG: 2'-5' RNA ligase family protein [Candidatus Woesearchaeota archaeon]